MTHLTRDVLIKTIVADEMIGLGGTEYIQNLKSAYHKWEHESSEALCQKFNSIKKTNLTVEILDPYIKEPSSVIHARRSKERRT